MQDATRIRRAAAAARAAGADALLVTHGPDVRWLTGFTGSNGAVALLFSGRSPRAVLFTDGRYTVQAGEEAAGMRIRIEKKSAAAPAVLWLAGQGATRCAYDAAHTTVAVLEAMRQAIRKDMPATLRRKFLLATDGLPGRLREVKDTGEIERMRRAASLGCALFEHVLGHLTADVTENEVAAQLEFSARMAGADAMSFETIVASGKRSALPHGRASAARLPRRGFVTLDFGVLLDGYCSDMTRTVHMGKANRAERDVYHAVLTAQEAAVAAVRPGATCEQVDAAARNVLKRARLEGSSLEKWFTHSTGHGVGLEIHEGPRLAAKQKQVLEPGMVITIEPGVYLPGKFGVRIEDMVLVTETGGDVLTAQSPKTLLEL